MSVVATREMTRLHDLMCLEALEGGLSDPQRRERDQLAWQLPEVNTNYYWEALGAADLALYGGNLMPPGEARRQWLGDAEELLGQRLETGDSELDDDLTSVLEVGALQRSAPAAPARAVAPVPPAARPVTAADGAMDETVMQWDSGAIDVDRYATDRGLHEGGDRDAGTGFGWAVITALVIAIGAAWVMRDELRRQAVDWGLVSAHQLAGEGAPVTLDAGGASIGTFTWDPVRQRGHLQIDAMPQSMDAARQFQVWLLDRGRANARIPVALLRTNRVADALDIAPSVRVKDYGGLLISSEPLGGSLYPTRGAEIAQVAPPVNDR